MVMKFLSLKTPSSSKSTKRQSSYGTYDSSSSSAGPEAAISMAAMEERCAILQMENRRLRQITARIASKIGVVHRRQQEHSSGESVNEDDDDCPPPHVILAQAHRLQKLNELVVALSIAPRAMDAYKVVAQYTREIVGAARVSISILGSFLQDHDDEESAAAAMMIPGPTTTTTSNGDVLMSYHKNDYLEIFGLDGNEGALSMGVKLPIDNTQIGHVAITRKPVRVMDCGNCEYPWVDIQNLHKMGVAACVDVPLISSGRVLGTLNTGVTDASVYFPEVEAMLLQIAAVLANAMEKERLLLKAQAAQAKAR